ncbi:1539_t:CDS:2, partial [Ambispora gerdemannii]
YWNRSFTSWGSVADWDLYFINEMHKTLAWELKVLLNGLEENSLAWNKAKALKKQLKIRFFFEFLSKLTLGVDNSRYAPTSKQKKENAVTFAIWEGHQEEILRRKIEDVARNATSATAEAITHRMVMRSSNVPEKDVKPGMEETYQTTVKQNLIKNMSDSGPKKVRIAQPDLRSHQDDKTEVDNGKLEKNYDEETELWQQNNLKQLCHGVQHPEEQNINNLLSVPSIFYFQQRNEQPYLDFLTANEITNIRSSIISEFVKVVTPDELIDFVKENKKKFQRDSLEEIARFIKLSSVKQNGSLLNETFFRLLEECATWNSSVDVSKVNEGTFIIDYIGPLFNKTIHYFNYVTIHSWIDTVSETSKLRRW